MPSTALFEHLRQRISRTPPPWLRHLTHPPWPRRGAAFSWTEPFFHYTRPPWLRQDGASFHYTRPPWPRRDAAFDPWPPDITGRISTRSLSRSVSSSVTRSSPRTTRTL